MTQLEIARKAAEKIVRDLDGRKGLSISDCDADVQQTIIDALASIVLAAIQQEAEECAAEADHMVKAVGDIRATIGASASSIAGKIRARKEAQ